MSIGFDWDKEDEQRRQRQAADDHFLQLQVQKKNRLRNAILGTLGTLVVIGLLILLRQKLYYDQLLNELRQAATSEVHAIRANENSTFLTSQVFTGGWPTVQSAAFDEYQQKSDRLIPLGEVVEAESDDVQGRIVLRELLDGKTYLVTWFYQRIEGRWRHGPPLAAYWGGRQQIRGEHVTVDTFAIDETQAEAIRSRIDEWWAATCALTACGEKGPPRMRVRLVFDLDLQPRWSPEDDTVLEIRSPHLGRVAEDGSLDRDFTLMLARQFAAYWANWQVPVEDGSTAEVTWLNAEIEAWLAHSLGVEEDAPLLGPLAEANGPEAVTALAEHIRAGESAIQALRAVTGSDPLTESYDWREYLAARLQAEAALAAQGEEKTAAELYGDPERPREASGLAGIAPESIQVVGIAPWIEVHWAETEFTLAGGGDDAPLMAGYEPFRLVEDEWLHTAPIPPDFGQTQVIEGEVVTLEVEDLDAPIVEGLVTDLDAQFGRAAADLGIPPQEVGRMVVSITSEPAAGDSAWGGETLLDFAEGMPGTIRVTVPSPHLTRRPAAQSAREAVRGLILRDMVIQMIRYRAYTINPRSPLVIAIARWELGRLAADPDAVLPVTAAPGGVNARKLDQMWRRCQGGPFVMEDVIGARVLIELLVDQHGPEAVSALVANLASAEDIDGWLESSLGIGVGDIEAKWAASTQIEIAKSQ